MLPGCVQASHCGFRCCGAQAVKCGLSGCDAWTLLPPHPTLWDLPGPRIKLMSPALAGGFLTIGPPGKYQLTFLIAAAAKSLQSCPTLCDPRTAAHQAPLSTGFSRQEYWSGLPFPSPLFNSKSSDICHFSRYSSVIASDHSPDSTRSRLPNFLENQKNKPRNQVL